MSNFIITAGGVSEPIDKVRKITNSSSGKLGKIIAEEILKCKSNVNIIYYICSKNAARPISDKVKIIEIENTMDLKAKVELLLRNIHIDYFIHSMAVADYMVDYITNKELLQQAIINSNYNVSSALDDNQKKITDNKISSNQKDLIIILKPTPKIISIIKSLSPETFLVGFKLLDKVSEQQLITVATELRDKNNCDLVIANDLDNIRKGKHKAFIIDRNDKIMIANDKEDIAKKLVKKIF